MSAVRIPADPWPFTKHRTWAEVIRTEELLAKARSMTEAECRELVRLLDKAVSHNPPPAPDVVA